MYIARMVPIEETSSFPFLNRSGLNIQGSAAEQKSETEETDQRYSSASSSSYGCALERSALISSGKMLSQRLFKPPYSA